MYINCDQLERIRVLDNPYISLSAKFALLVCSREYSVQKEPREFKTIISKRILSAVQ